MPAGHGVGLEQQESLVEFAARGLGAPSELGGEHCQSAFLPNGDAGATEGACVAGCAIGDAAGVFPDLSADLTNPCRTAVPGAT